MPFRVPANFEQLSLICGTGQRDPTEEEALKYIAWLQRELRLATAYLAKASKPPKEPAKKRRLSTHKLKTPSNGA